MAKINGIELDDIITLEEDIKKNFGSISVFATETGVSYRRVLKNFSNGDFTQEGFDKIKGAYEKNMESRDRTSEIPFRINDRERYKIRMCILKNFDSYTAFSKKHKKFDVVYLTNVIKGNLKLKSPKYASLVVLLNKKYELGIEL